MITFDDLTRLSPTDMQLLAKHVQPSHWALAFADTANTLRCYILERFTSEFADAVREHAADFSQPTLGQIERTRDDIVDTLTELVADGLIAPAS